MTLNNLEIKEEVLSEALVVPLYRQRFNIAKQTEIISFIVRALFSV
jgi:hypothetical protein